MKKTHSGKKMITSNMEFHKIVPPYNHPAINVQVTIGMPNSKDLHNMSISRTIRPTSL